MDVILFTRGSGEITIRNLPAGASSQDFQDAMQNAIDSGKATDAPQIIDDTIPPTDRSFRGAWIHNGGIVEIDMPKARIIHATRIVQAQAAEIARLKVEERVERLKGNTAQANAHATTVVALEALDLNVLATQIANAPNPAALSAVFPSNVPRL